MTRSFFTFLALLLPALSAPPASADSPPSWGPFEITSANGTFTATVSPDDPAKAPYDATWTLRVFEGGKKGTLKWSRPYPHNGYRGGLLTDDGNRFVFVEFWFRAESPQIRVFGKDAVREVTGEAFGIPEDRLQRTASHRLWLADSGATRFEGTGTLIVKTIDGKTHRLDLETGRLAAAGTDTKK